MKSAIVTVMQDVPAHKCLKIEDTSDLERHALGLLPLGFSFKAVNSTSGKIIGVFLNGNMSKNVSKP